MPDLLIASRIKRYQNKAVDLGNWQPPTMRSLTEDGEIVVEKVPSTAHCKMVKPSGGVHRIPLFNGMGKPSKNNPYFLQISREKLEKGFVPYGQCPKIHGLQKWLPKAVKDGAPCKIDATNEFPIDDGHPCACVVALIEKRQGVQAKVTVEIDKRYQSKEDRQTSDLAKAVSAISAIVPQAPTVTSSDPVEASGTVEVDIETDEEPEDPKPTPRAPRRRGGNK